MFRWTALLAPLFLTACAPKTPAPVAPVPDPEPAVTELADPVLGLEEPAHSRDTTHRMHAMLHMAQTARDRLTEGDLEGAKMAATALAQTEAPADLPDVWRPFIADVLMEADALSHADSAESAAGALGRLAVACGTCHTETGKVEAVRLVVLPPDHRNEEGRMPIHQWASDWMWFGLLTGEHQAYRLGATTFLRDNLPAPPEEIDSPELEALLAQVGDVAQVAVQADTDNARATQYGHLVATCANCHVAAGRDNPTPE